MPDLASRHRTHWFAHTPIGIHASNPTDTEQLDQDRFQLPFQRRLHQVLPHLPQAATESVRLLATAHRGGLSSSLRITEDPKDADHNALQDDRERYLCRRSRRFRMFDSFLWYTRWYRPSHRPVMSPPHGAP